MMYYTLLVASLIFAADTALIRDRRGGRIVGGHDAEIEDYPYQVSLQLRGGHWCGASIISENYILTAAHCLGFSNQFYTVRSGSSYHAKGGRIHKVVKQILHDDKVDIGIVQVNPPFKFDETQQPIQLADVKAKVGSLANVTGWGNTLEDGTSPDKLQAVEVPIISEKKCGEAYGRQIPEHEVCAGYLGVGGKDACQGDSGGPLVADGRQVGVVSWGWGCARPESPGVYVNVAHFSKWIKTKTKV